MAVILLFSTTSWKVEKHYCMGHLVAISFFVDAQDCGMDMALDSESTNTLEKKSCCNDEVIAFEGQNDVKPSFNDIHFENQLFLVAYSFSYLSLLGPTAAHNKTNRKYIPPKIVKNIQLLDDVFLI